jgi:hypothetical protein
MRRRSAIRRELDVKRAEQRWVASRADAASLSSKNFGALPGACYSRALRFAAVI